MSRNRGLDWCLKDYVQRFNSASHSLTTWSVADTWNGLGFRELTAPVNEQKHTDDHRDYPSWDDSEEKSVHVRRAK